MIEAIMIILTIILLASIFGPWLYALYHFNIGDGKNKQ